MRLSEIQTRLALCGNCKWFVAGGQCERVIGKIETTDICDIHEFGSVNPIDTPVVPTIDKIQVNYRLGNIPLNAQFPDPLLQEAFSADQIKNAIRDMQVRGIDTTEILRVVLSYLQMPNPSAREWPPDITGLDLLAQVPIPQVPATKFPPIYQPNTPGPTEPFGIPNVNPYPNNPTPDFAGVANVSHQYNISNPPTPPSNNWLGLATDARSEPPTLGVEPFNVEQAIQPWRYNVEDSQMAPSSRPISIQPSHSEPSLRETDTDLWKYIYQSHDNDDICARFSGKVFDLNDRVNRPVPPSESLGYTNTHPNCQCYWEIVTEGFKVNKVTKIPKEHLHSVNRKIGQRARRGTLHTVKPDGSLSNRTRHSNPLHEAILDIRNEFGWLTDDYLAKAKMLADTNGGQMYLIRASQATITDHRSEGEPLRRKLAEDEMNAMARTAINHTMDINHNAEWKTMSMIVDSEYDPFRKEIQMLVMEEDPEINAAIRSGVITAVSINGGSPRTEDIEPCEHGCTDNTCELCLVPRGVVLGELDDVALTWVVTHPMGLQWRGMIIQRALPGVKTTAIQPI